MKEEQNIPNDEAELVERATAQLEKRAGERIMLNLHYKIIVSLISQLQLAFRHPQNVGQMRNMIEKLTRDLILMLDREKGDVYKLLMRGFDEQSKKPEETNLGATGEFPRGKLHDADEGELTLAIGVNEEKNTVEIHFGKNISWLGLDRTSAENFADAIKQRAAALHYEDNWSDLIDAD